MIAHGVHETGRREIIGLDVGEAETEAFWSEFLRSLVARGLVGVQLAISDAHPGLKAAIAQVLGAPGSAAPCTSSATLRGHARKDQHDALGAVIRPIFTADARRRGPRPARATPSPSSSAGCRRSPRCSKTPRTTCSPSTRSRPSTGPSCARTNPLERFNREIGRRTDVVGIFPDDASLIRLVSMLAIEANDEWLVGRSYISRVDGDSLRDPDRARLPQTKKQGGQRAHRGLSRQPLHRRDERATSYTTSRDLTGGGPAVNAVHSAPFQRSHKVKRWDPHTDTM